MRVDRARQYLRPPGPVPEFGSENVAFFTNGGVESYIYMFSKSTINNPIHHEKRFPYIRHFHSIVV